MGALIFVGVLVVVLGLVAAYRQHKLNRHGDRSPTDAHESSYTNLNNLGGGGGTG